MANEIKLIAIEERNESTITEEAKAFTFRSSNGRLTSFYNVGDPLDVLVRTLAYVAAELIFRVNQLPLQFVLRLLELTGAVQSAGTKARATCTFKLTSTRTLPFTLPAGYIVSGSYKGKTLTYKTLETLVIPASATSGEVDVEAAEIGTDYNAPAGIINRLSQPYSYLQSVVNLQPAQGGSAPESRDSVINRAFALIRRKAPISAVDYEEEAQEILGFGSRAKAIGLLGLDKTTFEKGAVHVFLLSTTGLPANTAEVNRVSSILGKRVQLGTRLHVSPMTRLDVQLEIIAQLEDNADAQAVADDLWRVYGEQINPISYPLGQTVDPDELSHHLRFAEGIKYIEQIYINDNNLPIAMPNEFTMPFATGMLAHLVDQAGVAFDIVRGDYPTDVD